MNLRKLRWRHWTLITAVFAYFAYGFWLGTYHPIRNGVWCWAVWHVHSTVSDGIGDPRSIAMAAEKEGISTVILSDHSKNSPSSFNQQNTIHGVTILSGGEVALPEGRLGVFDCRPTGTDGNVPIGRLPDDPPAAIEDIHAVQGIAVEMYGGDPRFAMKYDSDDYHPDLIEYTNAMTLVRKMTPWGVCHTILFGFFTPFNWMRHWKYPTESLQRWDRMMSRGQIVHAIPAADAHGGFRTMGLSIPVPSYHDGLVLFGLGRPRGEPFTSAAIRNGQYFSCVRGAGDPAQFSFRAFSSEGNRNEYRWAGRLQSGTRPSLEVLASHALYQTRIRLYRNGVCLAMTTQNRLTMAKVSDGVYRVMVTLDNHPFLPDHFPWILSNAFHVGGSAMKEATDETAPQPANTREAPANSVPIDRHMFTPNTTRNSQLVLVQRDAESDIRYDLNSFGNPPAIAAIDASGSWKVDHYTGIAISATSDEDIRGNLILYKGSQQWRASFRLPAHKTVCCRLPWHRFFLYDQKQTRMKQPPSMIDRIVLSIDQNSVDRALRGHYRLHHLSLMRP